MTLDLRADPIALTAALVDIPSVSRDELAVTDAVEAALRTQTSGFEIVRDGNVVLARTDRGLPTRVVLAGHLDTVPIADNVPSRMDTEDGEPVMYGCGTVDMKSGDAVFLHLAATVAEPAHDLTLIFYDCEEIAAEFNGLARIERERPEWLDGDLAILGEPSGGWIEAAARAPCASGSPPRAPGRIRRGPGWATTPSTGWRRSCSGCPTTGRARSISTAVCTARVCLRCGSPVGWRAMWYPTPPRST